MKVWITRDKQDIVGAFGGRAKPKLVENELGQKEWSDGYSRESHYLFFMDLRYFKSLFGFTPRKGSCKQYELTLKEIT